MNTRVDLRWRPVDTNAQMKAVKGNTNADLSEQKLTSVT